MSSRTQAQLRCVHFSECEEMCCIELYTPMAVLDLSGPMDKPRQSDSFAGHVEGHIANISWCSTNMRGGVEQQHDTLEMRMVICLLQILNEERLLQNFLVIPHE